MLTLFTDTDSDMTLDVASEYGYHLISMPYEVNGKEILPYEDFEKFDSRPFYDMLRNGALPKTSAISPVKYISYFEPEFKKGNDILYVHFSKEMSGTFSALNIALEELKENYPNRKVYMIDTKGITICEYVIVRTVGDLVKAGKSIGEIMEWAKTEVDHFATYFYADDLKFFKNSGRISNFACLFGNALGIHPIIYMGSDGKMTSIGKVKGRKHALSAILDYAEKLEIDTLNHRIVIGHTDAIELAELLKSMFIERFGNADIEIVCVNPTCGCHCGPDSVGLAFYGKGRE